VELPSASFSISVGASGYRPTRLGPFEPDLPPFEAVVLQRAAHVRGVVRATGQPLARAAVHVHSKVRHGEAGYFTFGLFTTVEAALLVRGETDANGSFALPLTQAGTFCVHAEAPGLARGASGFFEFQVDRDVTDIDF
jgi:hypothetical protein